MSRLVAPLLCFALLLAHGAMAQVSAPSCVKISTDPAATNSGTLALAFHFLPVGLTTQNTQNRLEIAQHIGLQYLAQRAGG